MWTIKTWKFKTFKQRQRARGLMCGWIEKNQGRVQYQEIFVNNAYAVEYRPLRWIG